MEVFKIDSRSTFLHPVTATDHEVHSTQLLNACPGRDASQNTPQARPTRATRRERPNTAQLLQVLPGVLPVLHVTTIARSPPMPYTAQHSRKLYYLSHSLRPRPWHPQIDRSIGQYSDQDAQHQPLPNMRTRAQRAHPSSSSRKRTTQPQAADSRHMIRPLQSATIWACTAMAQQPHLHAWLVPPKI